MIRLRIELVFVLVLAISLAGLHYAEGWLLAVILHELAHGLVARGLGGRGPVLDLQLGAGDAYTSELSRGSWWVLAAGPVVSVALVLFMVGLPLGPPAAALGAFHWALFQTAPHPSSDGGVALRRWMRPALGERRSFLLLSWASGALALLILVLMWRNLGPRTVEPLVPWVAVALLMAVSEWPAVVHAEAWQAWQRGEAARTLALARRPAGRRWDGLRRLGLEAAMQLCDSDAVAELAEGLPTLEPTMLRAISWMLQRDDERGARWAERLVDLLSAGSRSCQEAADAVAEFGLYEARRGALDSSLGLFEQAQAWGFERAEWLDFRPEVQPLRQHPRWIGSA
ncbi:MAG: hypothetical protein AAGD10_08145 [Myxococcota bacterium]